MGESPETGQDHHEVWADSVRVVLRPTETPMPETFGSFGDDIEFEFSPGGGMFAPDEISEALIANLGTDLFVKTEHRHMFVWGADGSSVEIALNIFVTAYEVIASTLGTWAGAVALRNYIKRKNAAPAEPLEEQNVVMRAKARVARSETGVLADDLQVVGYATEDAALKATVTLRHSATTTNYRVTYQSLPGWASESRFERFRDYPTT